LPLRAGLADCHAFRPLAKAKAKAKAKATLLGLFASDNSSGPALQRVRRNRQVFFAVGGHDKLPLAPRPDAMALHALSHTILAHANATSQQFLSHPWPAVFLLHLNVDCLDIHQQRIVADALVDNWFARLVGVFALPMFEVATGADRRYGARQSDRPLRFVLCDRAYFTEIPARSTPLLFLECRAPSSRATARHKSSPTPSALATPACHRHPDHQP